MEDPIKQPRRFIERKFVQIAVASADAPDPFGNVIVALDNAGTPYVMLGRPGVGTQWLRLPDCPLGAVGEDES